MKYLIKTIGLVACLLTFPACEFGSSPDLSKLQEMEAADTSAEECDETCQNFKAVLEQKYGADWQNVCDEKCIDSEYDAFTKSIGSQAEETKTEDVKSQVSEFKFPPDCNADCQSEFMIYIVFNYDSCDDACKKAEFEAWFTPPTEPEPQQPTPQPEGEGEKNEPINPPAPPAPPPAPAQPVASINTDEVNKYIGKLGFAPDTVIILTPKYPLSSLDALKTTVTLPAEQQTLIDILPTLMTKAKYLLLAYKKDAAFMIVSPDAEANRRIEAVILKNYQATSPSRGLLKIGNNIGLARLSNAYIAGTPFSQVEAIFKGTTSARSAYAPCISTLAGKTFDSFISWVIKDSEIQKLFDIQVQEQKGPNNASCWYKMK